MSNATEPKTAKRLEPQPSAGQAPSSAHTKQPAQQTEREDSHKPGHAADATHASPSPTATGRQPCPHWCRAHDHVGSTVVVHRSEKEQTTGLGITTTQTADDEKMFEPVFYLDAHRKAPLAAHEALAAAEFIHATVESTSYTPVPLPEHCPAWCGKEHWHSKDPDEQDPDWELHGAGVAAGYLPEVRRMGRIVIPPSTEVAVTREYQGSWELTLIARRQRGRPGVVPDPVVELELSLGDEHPTRTKVELLASEARELAAGLLAAADKLLLSRGA
jgi:hypothetical protein